MAEDTRVTLKRMQKVVFEIICDIDNFCKENKIIYFLSGGTCLGAIRHHGFIPWDDDGDLMMPRPDYEKFLQQFPSYCQEKYFVGSLITDDDWQRPFSRVCDLHSQVTPTHFTEKSMGIFVDIFPIDGLPEGKGRQHRHYQKLRVLNALRNTSVRTKFWEQERYHAIKKAAALFTKKIGPRWFALKIDHMARKYSFENAEEVAAILAVHYWEKETIAKENMTSVKEVPFEGRMLPVPIGYDQYLKNLYGDYLTIPKDAAEKGFTHLDDWILGFDADECQHADDLPAEDDGKN